jgi:hypothetical protein
MDTVALGAILFIWTFGCVAWLIGTTYYLNRVAP